MNRERTFKYISAIYVALITFFVYIPSLQNEFVNWDDGMYVSANFFIRTLNFIFFKWAFFSFHAANWHPLTWFSHAIDYALWGLNPFGHHLTSIVLHGLNTLLVILLIVRLLDNIKTPWGMTERGCSDNGILITAVITGLLFGLHPIHVESVVWVSERKDLLYAFFYLLSLLYYSRYVKETDKNALLLSVFSSWNFRLSLLLFALSLMSKPMAVTLPVVLLILDWCPFGRFKRGRLTHVLVEKLPFLLFALGSAIITILAQHFGGAIKSFTVIPLLARILVGSKALIEYLAEMIYPVNLSPFYPYPQNVNMVTWLSYRYFVPLLLVIGITIICVIFLKRQKIWSVVWGYYLVTLLPVLGIIQVGDQAMADRYTYLPSIGPFFLIGFSAAWFTDRWLANGRLVTVKKLLSLFIAVLLFGALSYSTIRQTRVWENSETLWDKVLAVNPGIPSAYNNRGVYYRDSKQYGKAIDDFTQGMSIKPDYVPFYINRARVYSNLGRFEDALHDANEAMRLSPGDWNTYLVRATVYTTFELNKEALKDYTETIRLKSGLPEVYNNRGMIYVKLGLLEEAINDYTQAINLSSSSEVAYYYYNRGVVYKLIGKTEEALKDFVRSKKNQ